MGLFVYALSTLLCRWMLELNDCCVVRIDRAANHWVTFHPHLLTVDFMDHVEFYANIIIQQVNFAAPWSAHPMWCPPLRRRLLQDILNFRRQLHFIHIFMQLILLTTIVLCTQNYTNGFVCCALGYAPHVVPTFEARTYLF